MRKRREVPGRADRATRRHERQNAAVQAVEQQLDRLDARAGVAFRKRVRAQQHRRAHDLIRVGSPTPHACERSSRSCSSSVCSSGIDVETNLPKPVLTP